MGSNDSLAYLKITKVIPQNTIARETLKTTQNFFNLRYSIYKYRKVNPPYFALPVMNRAFGLSEASGSGMIPN
jgi:hypothetical protein